VGETTKIIKSTDSQIQYSAEGTISQRSNQLPGVNSCLCCCDSGGAASCRKLRLFQTRRRPTARSTMVAFDLVVFLLQAIAFLCISTIAICRIYSWIYLRYFVSLRTVGFFHPFCNSGGGGERVLWLSILSLEQLSLSSPLHCLIYSGDTNVESREILNRAHVRSRRFSDICLSF
jgi:hypothetical protein